MFSAESKKYKVLHIWDTRVDSGLNLDDSLKSTPLEQSIFSRVLVRRNTESISKQKFLYELKQIESPYPKNVFLRYRSQIIFKRNVVKEIAVFQPDLIFFHFGQCGARFVKKIERLKTPFVVALYGHDLSVALESKRWRRKYSVFKGTYGGFLVLANDPRRRLLSMGVIENQISLYTFPINIKPFLKLTHRSQDSIYRITIPGRFVEKKGHKYLFEAVILLKRRQFKVHLTILGYGERGILLEYLETLSILEQISWVDTGAATIKGDFNEIYAKTLSQTDLVVLPCTTSQDGDNEAGPALVLCLAQAAGVPVITTPFEGHEVSIVHGQTGLITKENDSLDLANQIEWCIHHPTEIAEIGQNAKTLIQNVFSFENTVEKLYLVLKGEINRQKVTLSK